jgi:hypothetical protein
LARYELLAPEIGDLAKELRRETAIAIKRYSWDNKYAALMYNKSVSNGEYFHFLRIFHYSLLKASVDYGH